MKLFNTTPANVTGTAWYSAFTDSECQRFNSEPSPETPFRVALPRHLKDKLIKEGIDIETTEFQVSTEKHVNTKTGVMHFTITAINPTQISYGLKFDDYSEKEKYTTKFSSSNVFTYNINGKEISRDISNRSDYEEFLMTCIEHILLLNTTEKNMQNLINVLEETTGREFAQITPALQTEERVVAITEVLDTGIEEAEEEYIDDDYDLEFEDDEFEDEDEDDDFEDEEEELEEEEEEED